MDKSLWSLRSATSVLMSETWEFIVSLKNVDDNLLVLNDLPLLASIS